MKKNKILFAASTAILLATSAQATLVTDKVTLKGNMSLKYNVVPKSVNSTKDILSEGIFYGRLRTNAFLWDWKDDATNAKLMDNKALGLGASIVYKSASFMGVSGTMGLYTSQNPSFWREDVADLGLVKAGKDTFSRYDTTATGRFGMSTVAQAYLQYDRNKVTYKLGRQLFESVFTKSNDTKMIPNSFDGLSAVVKSFPKTTIKLAYLAKQKLRDHTSSHDVIAYDPDNSWSQNDDSAVNRNLTVARVGSENSLLIASATNKSIKNLKANISVASVPDILTNVTLEGHYTLPFNGFKVVPGVRYMQQIDQLDANYGVANLKGKFTGYTDENSLDSSLLALRVDIKTKALLVRLGYSAIADEADIVAPWRGFPTGGFTRAMGQYNWYANTKTNMLRVGYDFGKANMIDGFSLMGRYAIQDFDDNKPGVQADTNVVHIDARQNINDAMELKLRLGFVNADVADSGKSDTSYNEYRVELNYFF